MVSTSSQLVLARYHRSPVPGLYNAWRDNLEKFWRRCIYSGEKHSTALGVDNGRLAVIFDILWFEDHDWRQIMEGVRAEGARHLLAIRPAPMATPRRITARRVTAGRALTRRAQA